MSINIPTKVVNVAHLDYHIYLSLAWLINEGYVPEGESQFGSLRYKNLKCHIWDRERLLLEIFRYRVMDNAEVNELGTQDFWPNFLTTFERKNDQNLAHRRIPSFVLNFRFFFIWPKFQLVFYNDAVFRRSENDFLND